MPHYLYNTCEFPNNFSYALKGQDKTWLWEMYIFLLIRLEKKK